MPRTDKPQHHRSCQQMCGDIGVELLEDTGSDWICDPTCPVANAQPYDPWYDNQVQFPRLLDEIRAVLDDDRYHELLAELGPSMDLPLGDIDTLFNRAERTWDRIKDELAAGQSLAPEFVISDEMNLQAQRIAAQFDDPDPTSEVDLAIVADLSLLVRQAYRKERGLE